MVARVRAGDTFAGGKLVEQPGDAERPGEPAAGIQLPEAA